MVRCGHLGLCTNQDVILVGCTIAANVIAQASSTDEERGAGIAFATAAMETIVSDAVEMERLMGEAEGQLGRTIAAEDLPDIDDTPVKKAALTAALASRGTNLPTHALITRRPRAGPHPP